MAKKVILISFLLGGCMDPMRYSAPSLLFRLERAEALYNEAYPEEIDIVGVKTSKVSHSKD